TESDLFELFNGVGHVQNAEVVSYRHNQRSKGFAFVQMQTVEEAKRAVEELDDKEFLGRRLVVSGAKSDQHQPREDSACLWLVMSWTRQAAPPSPYFLLSRYVRASPWLVLGYTALQRNCFGNHSFAFCRS